MRKVIYILKSPGIKARGNGSGPDRKSWQNKGNDLGVTRWI